MPEFWDRTKKWASGLPWYWKWVGYLLLALAFFGVLAVLVFGSGSKKEDSNLKDLDNLHADEVKATLDILEDERKELQAEIRKKKVEVYKKLNQAKKIDAQTIKDRKRLEDAETMEELDRLQEEMGL